MITGVPMAVSALGGAKIVLREDGLDPPDA